ncbi:F420-non-reducing hydrogenase subunit VhuG [Methanocaldococcus indicus]|uniref:F420-non-reducing hydrogenase subunit VhuG n=1 Tax=Methanocaldococcus indicus TaxID=213231 RepID=UPI003C6DB06D
MSKAKIGTIQLCGCSGCHISLLDLHDNLLDLLPNIEIVYSPILMDNKEIPEGIDVFLVEGGVRNEHDEHLLHEIREKSKYVIAFGTCAVYGGIPGLGNLYDTEELLKTVYSTDSTENKGEIPEEGIPKLTDVVKPISDVIVVDYEVPGCPPSPELIAKVLTALLNGEKPELPKKTVCDECPRKKENVFPEKFKRSFDGKPDPEKCLFEQGYTCLGAGTRAGCGAKCPRAGMPCRGCYGKTDATLDIIKIANTFANANIEEALKIPDKIALIERFSLPAALINRKIK